MRPCPELLEYLNGYIRQTPPGNNLMLWFPFVSEEKPEPEGKWDNWVETKQGWAREAVWKQPFVFSAAFVRAILEMRPDLKSAQLFYELSGGEEE